MRDRLGIINRCLPHHVIVVDICRDVLKFVGNVKVVLFSPKWLQSLEFCSRPGGERRERRREKERKGKREGGRKGTGERRKKERES